MKFLDLPGRILFAVPMMMSGFVHFSKPNIITRLVPKYIPVPEIWVYVTGVAFILAGISILIGKKMKLSGTMLGIMLLLFALSVHMDGFLKGNPLASSLFIRDMALAGAALFIGSKAAD